MGVKLVGDSKPIKPFTVEELAERLEAQKAFYDGVSIYLKQRGSQPLETSMFAHAKPSGRPDTRPAARPAGRNSGNYYGRPALKPATQSAGRFVNNQVCLYFPPSGCRARDCPSPCYGRRPRETRQSSVVLLLLTAAHRNCLD